MCRTSNIPSTSTNTVLLISGLRTNACRESVISALERVPGVRNAFVNLYRGSATIVHDAGCRAIDLIAAIQQIGYGCMLAAGQVRHNGCSGAAACPCQNINAKQTEASL